MSGISPMLHNCDIPNNNPQATNYDDTRVNPTQTKLTCTHSKMSPLLNVMED